MKVLVVGSPANANAYIAMNSAPNLARGASPRCCAWICPCTPRSWPKTGKAVDSVEK